MNEMMKKDTNRLVYTLAAVMRDLAYCQKRVEALYARYAREAPDAPDAPHAPDAHVGGGKNGAKESKERDIPPTPPIEKETKENLGTDRLIDTLGPSASASGNQSIDPLIEVSERDVREVRGGSLEPTEQEVATIATTALGIPGWYAKWWHRYMTAADWTTNRGERVNRRNWRPLMMTWWRNCREDERETIRREMESGAVPRESAAQMKARLLAEQEALFGTGEAEI